MSRIQLLGQRNNRLASVARHVVIGMISLGMVVSCASQPEMTVTFCQSLNAQGQCISQQDTFQVEDSIWMQLTSTHPFEGKEINGHIYRLGESDSLSLGDKVLSVEPGDTYVIQALPFHEFGYEAVGNFSIVFVDEKQQLLARKTLVIENK